MNTPNSNILTPAYAKFKVYKNGVLCSRFESPKDYTDFTQTEQTAQTFVDSSDTALSYTTGYKTTSDMYKYFIPLYVQGTVAQDPLVYRVDCEIKIGGMVRTLSTNLILIKDFIVAAEGTPLWGIINNAYYQQNNANYSRGSFYRSITNFITGTISVDGQYNNNGTWTTVGSSLTSTIYNGHSIFEYLPNITGIKLDGSTFASTIEGITNINLTNITGLLTFSI
jgi:hypothetical protein